MHFKDKSDVLRHNIDLCAKGLFLLSLFLFLLQTFHIKSNNECG